MEAVSVDQHLSSWLELQRTQLQPSTWREYAGNVGRYLVPHLGDRALAEVTHRDLTAFYRTLLTAGGLRGKPLALATVQRIAAMTHKVFEDAVRDELVPANPCDKPLLPRVDVSAEPRELRVWTAEQLAVPRPRAPPSAVAAVGGGRRHRDAPRRAAGLRWSDVDVDRATLHVRRALSMVSGTVRLKTPKTNRFRSLHVGAEVLRALEVRRDQQERDAAVRPAGTGPVSRDWGSCSPSPTAATSRRRRSPTPGARPSVPLHSFPYTFMSLRHTHATLLLQAGVISPKVVSARLGHASVKTTLDVYAEVLPAMDADAAAKFKAHVWAPGEDHDGVMPR